MRSYLRQAFRDVKTLLREQRWRVIALVVVFCLSAGVIVLAHTDQGRATVHLEIAAARVRLRLGSDVAFEIDRQVKDLGIRNLDLIEIPQPHAASRLIQSETGMYVEPDQESSRLLRIVIPRGSWLSVSIYPVLAIEVESPAGGASSTIDIAWAQPDGSEVLVMPLDPSHQRVDDGGGDATVVRAAATCGRTVGISFVDPGIEEGPWDLSSASGVDCDRIEFGFAETDDRARQRIHSTISDGTLRFPGIDRQPEPIRAAEALRLTDPQGYVISLAVTKSGIRFVWSGDAAEILAGYPPYLRSLKPSVLEGWIRSRTWILIGGVLATLFGTWHVLFGGDKLSRKELVQILSDGGKTAPRRESS